MAREEAEADAAATNDEDAALRDLLVRAGLIDPDESTPSREEAYARLVTVGLWLRKDADEHLIDVGLTIVEAVILRQHVRLGLLDIATLARMLKYSRTHIANLVRGLVQRGFIERLPQAKDRRTFATRITARGRALHDEALAARKVGEAFEEISEESRRHAYHSLERVRAIDRIFVRGLTGKTRDVLRREIIGRREGERASA